MKKQIFQYGDFIKREDSIEVIKKSYLSAQPESVESISAKQAILIGVIPHSSDFRNMKYHDVYVSLESPIIKKLPSGLYYVHGLRMVRITEPANVPEPKKKKKWHLGNPPEEQMVIPERRDLVQIIRYTSGTNSERNFCNFYAIPTLGMTPLYMPEGRGGK